MEMNYTAEAKELNAKLQVKRIKGLRFRISERMSVIMRGTYGVYVEGRGFMQWNHENAPICGTRDRLQKGYINEGLLSYCDVHFVQPCND